MALALAKPAPGAYTINEAAQHYPPFLWVPDMDTGATTIVNRGSGATATLAMTGMTRHEDGTHGAYWRTNRGSNGKALLNQDLLGSNTTWTLLIIGRCYLMALGDATVCLGGVGTNNGATDYNAHIRMDGSTSASAGAVRVQGNPGGTGFAHRINTTDFKEDWHIFSATFEEAQSTIKVNKVARFVHAHASAYDDTMGRRIAFGARANNSEWDYSDINFLAMALWPGTILTNAQLDSIYDDPWELLGVSTAAPSAQFVPVTEALYYDATRLDSKTNIRWMVTNGHGSLTGQILSSGLAGTTSAVGVFVPDATVDGDTTGAIADDPVTVHLYWEEGTAPVENRSLIFKTTLVAA